ncbi:hypothetical protein N9M78_05740 [Alphaproteobacteria bacterium]|nr:hypothetical protein [Alphaproteobacteria bacterium]
MAVILLFVLIQTYRFAIISSMTMAVAKLVKCSLMILTGHLLANLVINRADDQISGLAKAALLVTIARP